MNQFSETPSEECPSSTAPVVGADALMTEPDTFNMDLDSYQAPLKRSKCEYKNTSEKFRLKERGFKQQFSNVYFNRLTALQKEVMKAAHQKWKDHEDKPVAAESLMKVQKGRLCYLAGTVYKDMQLKPNILTELAQERMVEPPPPREKYVHEEDELVLEDGNSRVKLTGNIPLQDIVTGVVIGVLGREVAGGDFLVLDYCFAGLAPQPPLPVHMDDGPAPYVALVSGLKIGKDTHDTLPVQLLVDYITGQLGALPEQEFQSQVVRVIIAGNSLGELPEQQDTSGSFRSRSYQNANNTSLGPLKEVDSVFTQLACSVPVDVMAGESDPGNFCLPQQPLHPCLFPRARAYSTFSTVTNPYSAEIGGVQFLGSSGQGVNDIFKYTATTDHTTLVESTILWRHLAPTAPDTLGCYPYYDDDPFVIESSPHVYFVGNQPAYSTKMLEGSEGQRVRIVSVPTFADTHTAVLVNLRTLATHPISFSIAPPGQ
eukprot:comp11460_c0_seq1/m.5893 comp11460_c0_seq1/g.5893  ORF comp11460_c0_seq1/g.5893 comp11460_c0_seq1/m.5893 type:complete len:485 (-) comp11460_c0_seq1:167-1621(-)